MICKFCGNQIAAGDRECFRCGEPVQPLTASNGFYGLYPQFENASCDYPPPSPPYIPTSHEETAPTKVHKKENNRIVIVVITIMAIAFLGLSCLLGIRLGQMDRQLRDLTTAFEAHTEICPPLTEADDQPDISYDDNQPIESEERQGTFTDGAQEPLPEETVWQEQTTENTVPNGDESLINTQEE